MSVAVPRNEARIEAPAPAALSPAELARFAGWAAAAVIIYCAVYFHSNTDPGVRYAIKNSGLSYNGSWWDSQKLGPFTPGDAAVFAFAYFGLIARLRRGRIHISRRIAWLTGAGLIAILQGVAVGIYHHTPSPFGDWRDLFVGYVFAFALWSTVLRTERDSLRFAQLFVFVLSVYGAYELAQYAHGGGEIAFYGRTPTGDHATLEYMVATVGISLALLRTRQTRWLWWSGIAVGTAVVLLAFRRYAWVEIGTVFGVFLVFSGVNRRRYLFGLGGVMAVGIVAIGLTWSSLNWSARLASVNPTQTRAQNVLATTNQGHINDILDGLDQVKARPFLGLGAGVLYHPPRSSLWKGQVGMVHNGPIEVWIKFGLLGLVVFLGTYVVLFRDIWRRRSRGSVSDMLAFGGGAFLLGNFLVIATVYGWQFATWEKGILIFSVIAMAYPPGRRSARPDATATAAV
jgi:O-antigen ligase